MRISRKCYLLPLYQIFFSFPPEGRVMLPSIHPHPSDGLVVDLFAGGGGASEGLALALGRDPDIAINHDPEALTMHKANHPGTKHLLNDITRLACPGNTSRICHGGPFQRGRWPLVCGCSCRVAGQRARTVHAGPRHTIRHAIRHAI